MLCKLSLKNIGKSMKDYAIYFFTLIAGVAIFYVFNAIETQSAMMKVSKDTREIITLMTQMLSGVSVFVAMILAFLIIYASRFLIKRRNKEFGIYMILGMGKRRISMILFLETLFIGIISLAVGLLVGVGLSQVMSVFVANMFEADMTEFSFVFSKSACVKTMAYFGVMYLVVMIFNTFSISKCKLIHLLQAGKRTERVKLKNLWLCVVVFVIGAVMLGSAYYMVTVKVGEWGVQEKILVPIALGIVSTFLIFWSLSGLLLKLVMSVKSFYFKGLNSFTLRQLSSQVNTMVFSMTIICLMLFVTICVLSACLTMKNSLEKQIDELAPVDVQLKKTISVSEENDIVEIDNGHSIDSYQVDSLSEEEQQIISMSVEDLYAEYGIDLYDYLDNPLRFYVYHDPSLTFGATLGDRLESLQEMYQFLDYTTPEDVVRISDYNQVATLYGLETYTLKEDEYMVVADFASMVTLRDEALSAGENITVFGHSLKPKYNECQSGFIDISSNHINTGIIIVPDDVVDDHYIIYENFIGNYKKMSEEELRTAQETVQLLNFDEVPDSFSWISRSTKEEIREASIGLGALVSFIGLYLGVVFLISAAAIMALKELSESTDNIERYCMLRKLGADEKMIHKALFRQIGIFFAMPLALAILHSIFGMKFSMIFLAVLGTSGMTVSIVTTAVILALIYGGYFVLTYVCSKNMIKC